MTWDSQFEGFEFHGRWWQPDSPEQDVGGVLSYQPEQGVQLTITSELPGEEANPISLESDEAPFQPDLLLGATENEPATLLNLQLMHWQGPGHPRDRTHIERTYWVETLLLGAHWPHDAPPRLESVYFSFTNFEEWLNLTPFGGIRGEDDDPFDHKIVWTRREDERFEVDEIDGEIHICHSWGGREAPVYRDFELTSRALLGVIPEDPKPVSYYREVADDLGSLLGIMVDAPVFVDHAQAYFEERGDEVHRSVNAFWGVGTSNKPESANRWEIPYGPEDKVSPESPGLEEMISRWFGDLDNLRDPANLFSTVQRERELSLEIQLLLLTQALESFHRRRGGGHYMEPEEYQQVEEELISAIPNYLSQAHTDALENKIHYGHEYSLRKRLADLLDSLPEPLLEPVLMDVDPFIGDIVDTRNYFTHYDPAIPRLSGQDLWRNVRRLELILQLLFIDELDVHPFELHVWLRRKARRLGIQPDD